MKKIKYLNTRYMGISKLENHALSLVNRVGIPVFGVGELEKLSGFDRTRINNTLFSLHKKGLLTRLERDRYVITEGIPGREFEIATNMIMPSYVSFWSASSFYGFTEQQVSTVQLVSPRQHKPMRLMDRKIEVTCFKPERFFGYERLENFSIATKEKAIVDSLSDFKKSGGLNEYVKCLKNSWDELDKKVLTGQLLRFKNRSMNSRFGFLLDALQLDIDPGLRKRIHDNASTGFVRLDASKPGNKGRYDKTWKIQVNAVEVG